MGILIVHLGQEGLSKGTKWSHHGTILGQNRHKDSPKIGKDSPKKGLCERKGRIIAHFCSLVRKLFGRASEAVRIIASGSPSGSASPHHAPQALHQARVAQILRKCRVVPDP